MSHPTRKPPVAAFIDREDPPVENQASIDPIPRLRKRLKFFTPKYNSNAVGRALWSFLSLSYILESTLLPTAKIFEKFSLMIINRRHFCELRHRRIILENFRKFICLYIFLLSLSNLSFKMTIRFKSKILFLWESQERIFAKP